MAKPKGEDEDEGEDEGEGEGRGPAKAEGRGYEVTPSRGATAFSGYVFVFGAS
jgi:hypothetical protein